MGKSALWVTTFTLVLTGFLTARAQAEANFKCSSNTNATCRALIDYSSQNATTLRDIQKLFNVKHLPDLLGANANTIPENASGSYSVAPKQVVRIPFPCTCSNGTGLSNHVPLYKIKPGDGLDEMALKGMALKMLCLRDEDCKTMTCTPGPKPCRKECFAGLCVCNC